VIATSKVHEHELLDVSLKTQSKAQDNRNDRVTKSLPINSRSVHTYSSPQLRDPPAHGDARRGKALGSERV
jgi:hypothetical protein